MQFFRRTRVKYLVSSLLSVILNYIFFACTYHLYKMHFPVVASSVLLTCVSRSLAETIPSNHYLWGEAGPPTTLGKRQQASATPTSTRVPDSACTNGPFTRSCWSNGFSAATDFDAKWPTTGKTVRYNFELQASTCNPDGSDSRPCVKINGQYPGPTVYAGK